MRPELVQAAVDTLPDRRFDGIRPRDQCRLSTYCSFTPLNRYHDQHRTNPADK